LEGGGQIATELASRPAFASLDEAGENTAKVDGGYLGGWPGGLGGESVLDVPAKDVAGIARGWLAPSLAVRKPATGGAARMPLGVSLATARASCPLFSGRSVCRSFAVGLPSVGGSNRISADGNGSRNEVTT
jgi:hypothetical protein